MLYSAAIYFRVSFPTRYLLHIELNRLSAKNAFNKAMCEELHVLFACFSNDPEVRIVTILGSGDEAFSAGVEFSESTDPLENAMELGSSTVSIQKCLAAVEKCSKRTYNLETHAAILNATYPLIWVASCHLYHSWLVLGLGSGNCLRL